jgi:hypothetical protein
MDSARKSSFSQLTACVEVGTCRKSRHSVGNGACVEIGSYRKASYSNPNGACVQVGAGDGVGVRDTTQEGVPGRTELEFSAAAWSAFTGRLKA